jgi:ABC-type antimicrobial peptide transport system permease subunit
MKTNSAMKSDNVIESPGKRPSTYWLRVLKWFCPENLQEGIEGDLLEQFEEDVKAVGLKKAKTRLILNVIRFFRPGIVLRNKFSIMIIQWSMLQNYFKVAWRNMLRHQVYTIVNLSGLTLGLAVAIVLFLIVKFENSFDTYHANAKKIYQLKGRDKFGESQSQVPQGVIKALNDQFPAVEHAVSVYRWDPQVIRVDNKNMQQDNNYFLHPEFLKMIDVTWKSGSVEQSLSKPFQVVLDEVTAQKFFGKDDPIGRVIRYDNNMDLTVSGVIEKVPVNSEFQFRMIMSYETLTRYMGQYGNENHWGGGDSWFHGYVFLEENADIKAIERQLNTLVAVHKDEGTYESFSFLPLTEKHFDTDTDPFNYVAPSWMVQVLVGIAFFLLVIASINFVNLATAQATTRSREIGVRKALGSNRASVMVQFLTETAVMVMFSLAIASALALLLIPYADYFFNSSVGEGRVWDLRFTIQLIGLAFGLTIVAGFYPSMLLSGFKAIDIFKNQSGLLQGRSISLRKSLVILQFVIAQVLVICMIIGTQQIKYFHETDLGFERDNIITVNMPFRDSVLLQERFKQQLVQHPEIEDVAYGLTSPSSNRNWWWGGVKHAGLLNGEATFRLQWIDHNYVDFYNIQLLAGRNFVKSDTSQLALINETAMRDLGFDDPQDVLGESLTFWGSNRVTVVGVVKDYHAQGLKAATPPHLYLYGNWNFQLAQIKIDSTQSSDAIALVEKYWRELHPNNYFEYDFLADELDEFYQDESKLSNFIVVFAIVGILVGCLGLFGLVSFVCAKRSKEVSIRKVLGATLANIVRLLTLDFLILVSLAFILATPIGWYLMDQWLNNYENHITIHWTVFLVAGLLTLVLAFITVCARSLSTARMNPADSLKCE